LSIIKISIITVILNNKSTIKGTINSVLGQTYQNIEYIVIDGGSTDGSVEIIEKYRDKISFFLSEPDKGVYDALNKGIRFATGEVVAILNSDDLFYNKFVVSNMMRRMCETNSEICFSDLVVMDKPLKKIIRYYSSGYFSIWMLRMGYMPPHPTCFINKALFDEFGSYSLKYKIAGDFDFLVRIFYARKIRWGYLNRITVKMRQGGLSNKNFNNKQLIFREINKSLNDNDVWALPIFQLGRYLIRFFELIIRP